CTRYLLAHGGSQRYAIACNPTSFVDAVSISGWAYANRVPVMLQTWGDTAADRGFDAEAQQILAGRQLIVAGGPAAVSDESLAGIDAASVTRLGGADAFQTSLSIAEWELEHGMSASSISVASAIEQYNGVDALAASALAGRRGGVLLLAQSNPAYEPAVETGSALGFISEHASEVSRVHVLGGEVAQTADFYQQIEDALGE
ncbi:MAG: cell wall-binding repeat-containing protein, partial [Coriobacteriales bacterium]|nr:cell wall-binding repeat-containing protein [Coriobacteriales bacterium]